MHYVIDGYNLLHKMGVLHGRVGPTGLRRARQALLGLLHAVHGRESAAVTVVFDAAHAPAGLDEEQDYHGIHVHFAVHHEQADDLIEALIRHDPGPRQLTVVSDDHRLQQAAHRRHCIAWGCAEYMDWLEQHRHARRPLSLEPAPKPERLSPEEMQHWLREFADLQNDPNVKELSDPPEWETDLS
jgi:predicted RNA-binding protein with PIN domain